MPRAQIRSPRVTLATWIGISLVATGLSIACGADRESREPDDEPPGKHGDTCNSTVLCAEGLACSFTDGAAVGLCRLPCDSDEECSALDGDYVCAMQSGGGKLCSERCLDASEVYDGICLDGVPTPCSVATCPAGTECIAGEGCLRPYGAACAEDADCSSGECRENGVCASENGGPCTAESCDDCAEFPLTGHTICSGDCDSDWQCADPSACTSSSGYCWLPCDSCASCRTMEYYDGPAKNWCDDEVTWLEAGAGGAPN